MMRNKAKELALLDPFFIPFQIYEIKEGQPYNLMTLQMRRMTWVNLQIHTIDKEVEDSSKQTTKETVNTN